MILLLLRGMKDDGVYWENKKQYFLVFLVFLAKNNMY
jgi:hypothetical protein